MDDVSSDDGSWGREADADRESDDSLDADLDPGSDRSPGDDSPLRAVGTALGLGLLGPIIAIALAIGVGIVNATVEPPLAVSLALSLFFGQYVAFGGLSLYYLSSRGFDRPQIRSYLGIEWPSLRDIGLVIGSWILIMVLLIVVLIAVSALGTETGTNQSAELAMDNPAIIPLLILASFLVIGPSEEILYRGVVQGRLREALSPAPAIVLASGIFAFVHVMALTGGVNARLATVAILFVPSLVFGAVYEYTDNLVVPVLLHGFHNAVLFSLIAITVIYDLEEEAAAEAILPAVAALPV